MKRVVCNQLWNILENYDKIATTMKEEMLISWKTRMM